MFIAFTIGLAVGAMLALAFGITQVDAWYARRDEGQIKPRFKRRIYASDLVHRFIQ